MALLITDDCTNCDACVPECPNTAIEMGEEFYEIDPDKCTECVGAHDEPQCIEVCPAECIFPDPDHKETKDQLQTKYEALNAA